MAQECLDDADEAAVRGGSRLAWNRRKQRGLIKAVHEELVPEGFLAAEQAVALEGLYAQRLNADYGDFIDIPLERVRTNLETARRFVAAMRSAVDARKRP